jgi:endonuclease/exonuclease/phosphatase (EEP) superfamily protein YafD
MQKSVGMVPLHPNLMPQRVTARAWRIGWALAAPVTAAGLLLVLATSLQISRVVPFAALLGPRNALTALACAGSVIAAVTLLWRPCRPVVTPLALSLLVLTVMSGTVVARRGFADPKPAPPAAGQLRILSWNTNHDLVDPPTIAALAARLRANIVVLPDANIAWTASSYAHAFEAVKYPMRLGVAPRPSAQIAVFVAAPYGDRYRHVLAGPDPDKALRITPDTGDLPTIVALHAAKPTLPGSNEWNTEINWVAEQCRSGAAIAVGDFNATVDGFGTATLGNCADAATARRAGSVGTWPTAAPTWLGMPIDHILVSPGWHPQNFATITDQDRSGARHRPIFATLTR